jgi:hypothetical protein
MVQRYGKGRHSLLQTVSGGLQNHSLRQLLAGRNYRMKNYAEISFQSQLQNKMVSANFLPKFFPPEAA